mmetsp:Transcript_13178/g.55180  ORF Transcript_13178/g.55180 Transcript_13178/m.55180 type:complete len:331 (-) Transcript_13178:149-1141(-)
MAIARDGGELAAAHAVGVCAMPASSTASAATPRVSTRKRAAGAGKFVALRRGGDALRFSHTRRAPPAIAASGLLHRGEVDRTLSPLSRHARPTRRRRLAHSCHRYRWRCDRERSPRRRTPISFRSALAFPVCTRETVITAIAFPAVGFAAKAFAPTPCAPAAARSTAMVIIPAVVGRVVRQSHNPIRAALAVVIAATAASWITSARLLYVRVRTKFRGPQRCPHRRRAGARALLAPTGRRWQHPGRWVGALAATQETVNCSEEHEAARGRFRRLRRRRDCRPLGRARRGGDPGIVRLSPHHVNRHTSSAPHLPRAALRRAHLRPKQGMAA